MKQASKQPRFTRKVYECWALETMYDKLAGFSADGRPDPPLLYATRRRAWAFADLGEHPIRLRVTVERIDKRKKAK